MTSHQLATNQLKELKEAFDVFDVDRSGEISRDELTKVLKALDINYGEHEVSELMDSMDRNKDGSIQFYEFVKIMGSSIYKKKSDDDIIAEFKMFDKDNNGSITVDEVFEVMKKFRGNLTKKEVVELVKMVGKDGNGTINIAEFIALMSTSH